MKCLTLRSALCALRSRANRVRPAKSSLEPKTTAPSNPLLDSGPATRDAPQVGGGGGGHGALECSSRCGPTAHQMNTPPRHPESVRRVAGPAHQRPQGVTCVPGNELCFARRRDISRAHPFPDPITGFPTHARARVPMTRRVRVGTGTSQRSATTSATCRTSSVGTGRLCGRAARGTGAERDAPRAVRAGRHERLREEIRRRRSRQAIVLDSRQVPEVAAVAVGVTGALYVGVVPMESAAHPRERHHQCRNDCHGLLQQHHRPIGQLVPTSGSAMEVATRRLGAGINCTGISCTTAHDL